MELKRKYIVAALIVAVLSVSAYFLSGPITGFFVDDDSSEGGYGDFAKCLSESGAVMYGTSSCGYCKRQKDIFGDSFQHIIYVECTEEADLCREKGISGVPAWEIDGTIHTGYKTMEKLSDLSGCSLV